jgi:hypothetical protein
MSWYEPQRPRQIVRIAASQVKNPSTKSWLRNDAKGTWENMVKRYLDGVPEIIEKKGLHLSDAQIDEEIAHYLIMAALEATLANAKKRKKR